MTPVYEALRRHHVRSRFFHADETRWRVFVEKAGKIGHQWWLWLFASDDSVVYVLDPGRSHDVPQKHFPAAARGVLVVDRYSGYKAMQQVKVYEQLRRLGHFCVHPQHLRGPSRRLERLGTVSGWIPLEEDRYV